jgi:tagatose 6-phosphate kinase
MSRPILVVALNPALDITYELATVEWAGVNRPTTVLTRPGGKGLNVARILHALGADVLVTGLAGGLTGDAVRSALTAAGIRAAWTGIAGETRRTVAVADTGRGHTAMFNEPGPEVAAAEYARFRAGYESALAGCAAVVLSGSLPRGLPQDSYAGLIAAAAAAGVPAVLDAGGPALRHGAAAGPAVAKPNLAELAAVAGAMGAAGTGTPPLPAPDGASETDVDGSLPAVVTAAGRLQDAGARAVVVSLGAAGLLAVTGDGVWRARPHHPVTGNPTGAGDAVAAGLTHWLVLGHSWPERLRHAVALGSAAVAAPAAGEFCAADYERALAGASVARLGKPT